MLFVHVTGQLLKGPALHFALGTLEYLLLDFNGHSLTVHESHRLRTAELLGVYNLTLRSRFLFPSLRSCCAFG